MPSSFNGIANNTHPSWWMDPCLRKNVFWLSMAALASVYGGYDGSLLNGLQALPKFFETFPRLQSEPSLLGLVGAVQFLPGLCVPFIGAIVADRYGRKIPMIATAALICVGAVIQCTSKSVGVFVLSRLIVGIATTFGWPVASAMLVELAH